MTQNFVNFYVCVSVCVNFVSAMDTYELADLMALSPAERATLNCVKVRGQTRGTLLGLTTQLGARLHMHKVFCCVNVF
jgi:hypothetical protein